MQEDPDVMELVVNFEGTNCTLQTPDGQVLAKRQDAKWVSQMPGVTVRDIRRGKRWSIEVDFNGEGLTASLN